MRRTIGHRFPRLGAALALAAALGACGRGEAAPLGEAALVAQGGAGNPTVAVDARSGAAFAAWVGTADGASDVWIARVEENGAWSPPVRVNDVPGDAAPHEQAPAQVAAGPDGRLYVLWQTTRTIPGRRFPASNLRLAASEDGGKTWGPAVTVNDDADGVPTSHTFHDVAVAEDGTVYVSWIDGRARDGELARRAAASPAPAAPPAAHAGHARMPRDTTLPTSEVRVAWSRDGGRTFTPGVIADADVCPCCRTSLAIGGDGAVYLAWRKEFGGDVRDVVVARMAPGAETFDAPVRVHEDGWVFPACPHAGPSVAVDGAGRVHVAWYTGREGRQGAWRAVSSDDGRTFGAPRALLTAEWVPPVQVALVPRGGDVVAVWDDRRTGDPRVWMSVAGGAPEEVAAGRAPALDAHGGAGILAWWDGESVHARRVGGR